jgi:hypothetical protein
LISITFGVLKRDFLIDVRKCNFCFKSGLWRVFATLFFFLVLQSHSTDPIETSISEIPELPFLALTMMFNNSTNINKIKSSVIFNRGGHRGHDRTVVGFTNTYAISAYHHWCCEFESRSGRGVQHYVIKFVSDLRHDIAEILLMALSTIKQTNKHIQQIQ